MAAATGSDADPAGLRVEESSRLVLLADRFTEPRRAIKVEQAVEAGVRRVQLRDHAAGEEAFARAAERLVQRLRARAPGVSILVNTRWRVARRLGTGLHVGARGPAPPEARQRLGPNALLGFSAHDVEEARRYAKDVDYFFISPIFSTSSKPHHVGAGLRSLTRFCHACPGVPVYALGGVTPGRVAACLQAGAQGVAVLSGIMDADDAAQAARAYLDALRRTLPQNPGPDVHPKRTP